MAGVVVTSRAIAKGDPDLHCSALVHDLTFLYFLLVPFYIVYSMGLYIVLEEFCAVFLLLVIFPTLLYV